MSQIREKRGKKGKIIIKSVVYCLQERYNAMKKGPSTHLEKSKLLRQVINND